MRSPNTTDESERQLEKTVYLAGRKVRDTLETVNDELGHLSDRVASGIRSKPVQSSFLALAAGFALGLIMCR